MRGTMKQCRFADSEKVCPVTSTKVVGGTTQIVTFTTTSILTVTECQGGCGEEATTTLPPTYETQVFSIPSPLSFTNSISVTTELYETETTTCAVTETQTISGEVVTVV